MSGKREFDVSIDIAHRIAAGEPIDMTALRGLDPKLARGMNRLAEIARSLTPDAPSGKTWGHLQRLQPAGAGTFGEVFRAYDPMLDRDVALKLRRKDAPSLLHSGRDFVAEAQRLARVRHPNVLAVHGAGYHDDRAGLWADWIEGETLQARLAREGRLDAKRWLSLARELADALAAVHAAGLVHGDVKPGNVMLDAQGRALLMDFGAGFRSSDEVAALGAATPEYLAPEIVAGAAPTSAVDMYALGVLLHRAACGRLPVDGKVDASVRPVAHRRLIARLLDVPTRRPGAAALVHEIDALRAAPLHRARRIALAAALLGLAALGMLGWWDAQRARALSAQAELARVRAEQNSAFLQDLFARAAADALGPQATMRDLLDEAPRLIEQRFAARPVERIDALRKLVEIEGDLGNEVQAARLARSVADIAAASAPGEDLTLVLEAEALRRAAVAHRDAKQLEAAQALLARAQRERRPLAVVARIEFALGSIEVIALQAHTTPALVTRATERLMRLLQSADALDARARADAMRHVSTLSIAQGDIDRGIRWAEQAVAEAERNLGAEHALTALSRRILGWSLMSAGQDAHAERLFRENLTMHERKLGRHSVGVAEDLMGLSYALCNLGRADEAMPLARESYDLTTAFYGATHPSAIDAGLTLAEALRARDLPAARALMTQLRARIEAARGVDNRRYIQVTQILGQYAQAEHQQREAQAYFAECARLADAVLGADHFITRECRAALPPVPSEGARAP